MISRICGQIVARTDHSLIILHQGLSYEVLVPYSVGQRIPEHQGSGGEISLVTYHYLQMGPSSALPVLIGFITEIERDFFLQFIKVSGIGPRAAVKALNKPISEIARAIDQGDYKYLKTLPGIGIQKAKEIVAKLQGKVGKYGLIQDQQETAVQPEPEVTADWQQEALDVLLQLQYTRAEAKAMIQKALDRSDGGVSSTEDLLNEIYKQRISAK